MAKVLETNRLVLREWMMKDAAALFEICRDERVMRYIGTGKPYKTIAEAEEFLNWAVSYQRKNGFCRWALLEKSSGQIIGSCGFAHPHQTLEVELGYLLGRKFWNRGFATEAANACLNYGFEKLGFREIIAMTDLENISSQKVLKKTGFVRRGVEFFGGEENLVYLAKNPKYIL